MSNCEALCGGSVLLILDVLLAHVCHSGESGIVLLSSDFLDFRFLYRHRQRSQVMVDEITAVPTMDESRITIAIVIEV